MPAPALAIPAVIRRPLDIPAASFLVYQTLYQRPVDVAPLARVVAPASSAPHWQRQPRTGSLSLTPAVPIPHWHPPPRTLIYAMFQLVTAFCTPSIPQIGRKGNEFRLRVSRPLKVKKFICANEVPLCYLLRVSSNSLPFRPICDSDLVSHRLDSPHNPLGTRANTPFEAFLLQHARTSL